MESLLTSLFSHVAPIATNSHVLSAAAGAITTWAVGRFSTFMGWYAKNEAAISKATGIALPAKLPTTVAQLKAAEAAAVSPSIIANVEATPQRWLGDIIADIKKL